MPSVSGLSKWLILAGTHAPIGVCAASATAFALSPGASHGVFRATLSDSAGRDLCSDSASAAKARHSRLPTIAGWSVGLGTATLAPPLYGNLRGFTEAVSFCRLREWTLGFGALDYSGVATSTGLVPRPSRLYVHEIGFEVQRKWGSRSAIARPLGQLGVGVIRTSYGYSSETPGDKYAASGMFLTSSLGWELRFSETLRAEVLEGYQLVRGLSVPGLDRRVGNGVMIAARIRWGVF